MTTTKTITVSFSDDAATETFQAAYFQIEDGWATFKTTDGKAVIAYPQGRITRIKSEAAAATVINVSTDEEVIARARRIVARPDGVDA